MEVGPPHRPLRPRTEGCKRILRGVVPRQDPFCEPFHADVRRNGRAQRCKHAVEVHRGRFTSQDAKQELSLQLFQEECRAKAQPPPMIKPHAPVHRTAIAGRLVRRSPRLGGLRPGSLVFGHGPRVSRQARRSPDRPPRVPGPDAGSDQPAAQLPEDHPARAKEERGLQIGQRDAAGEARLQHGVQLIALRAAHAQTSQCIPELLPAQRAVCRHDACQLGKCIMQ
mmetsp:Transcript_3489/g.10153  ORF Transcript_3489/g.10153 Transcript_3489/m.10153 type:complete len:225 (+) Transcript_3489:497-1171(+)